MKSRARMLMVVFAALGLAASSASTWVHYRLVSQPGYVSPCDVNATVSCTQAYLSQYGSLFGVPVALLGAVFFAIILALVLTAPGATPAYRENVSAYVFVLSTIGLAFVFYLGYGSFFVLKAVCLLCVATYVAVIGLFITSSSATTVPLSRIPSRLGRDLKTLASSPVAIAVVLVFLAGAGWLVSTFPREGQGTASAASPAASNGQPGQPGQLPPDFDTQWKQAPREDIGVPSDGAKVVIVKFNDYQCPACAQAHALYKDLIKSFQAKYPGQIKSVTMDYPLEPECNFNVNRELHAGACEAAAAVRMARPLGRAEQLEEWLYTNQGAMSRDTVRAALQRIAGITDFDTRYPAVIRDVQRDIAAAGALRIGSTPTYFINGVRIAGHVIPAEWFQKAIELELQKN